MTDLPAFYKVLNEHGRSTYTNTAWPLPTDDGPGDWLKVEGELEMCSNGIHLCRPQDVVRWLGPVIYEAEPSGEIIESDDKIVCRKARLVRRMGLWNERTARLFAADCAEHVLHIYERDKGASDAPRKAIEVARLFAEGKATREELTVAGDAAWDAMRGAMRGTARAVVGNVAWDAAWDAAGNAAWGTARAAEGAAVKDATGDAARAAAWGNTARAVARDAAWAAVKDATGATARAAARAAAHEWQTKLLGEYLSGARP